MGPDARGADQRLVRDVSRWQQLDGQALASDLPGMVDKALHHPIDSVTFKVAEREAMKRASPRSQWVTRHAMVCRNWPALEMTLKVGEARSR